MWVNVLCSKNDLHTALCHCTTVTVKADIEIELTMNNDFVVNSNV